MLINLYTLLIRIIYVPLLRHEEKYNDIVSDKH